MRAPSPCNFKADHDIMGTWSKKILTREYRNYWFSKKIVDRKKNMFLLVHRRKEVMQYEYNPTLTQKLQLEPELHVARYHRYLSARDAEP
jgi:hypothetical protein